MYPRMRGAALAGMVLGAVALGGCASTPGDGGQGGSGSSGQERPSPRAQQDGDDVVDAPTTTLCVERYSPRKVAQRAFAFDGTVRKVGAGGAGESDSLDVPVTFRVHEWFHGGGAARTVTVDMAPPGTGTSETSVAGGPYDVGARLLVSGEPRWGGAPLDEPVAWGCGFTRHFDKATAASWRGAGD